MRGTKQNLIYSLEFLFDNAKSDFLIPNVFPKKGVGEVKSIEKLAPLLLKQGAKLGDDTSLAHMDPPTPWMSWVATLYNASLNQNMLHEETAPFAKKAEDIVIGWLKPYFMMSGGHMCSGSTMANMTALWAARQIGIKKVVCSKMAHISIEKSCHLLGLECVKLETNNSCVMQKPNFDLSDACLVLTVGTTGNGAIDPLELIGMAKYTHIDAAWAGPLRMCDTYKHLLEGIQKADSIAISAHKMFFQPKDSAMILFREYSKIKPLISYGGNYLKSPNVGIQGSRHASALPLFMTLLAWGEEGFCQRINTLMNNAKILYEFLICKEEFEVLSAMKTGINVFRHKNIQTEEFLDRLPKGMFSSLQIDDTLWIRSVSANPNVKIDKITHIINKIIK